MKYSEAMTSLPFTVLGDVAAASASMLGVAAVALGQAPEVITTAFDQTQAYLFLGAGPVLTLFLARVFVAGATYYRKVKENAQRHADELRGTGPIEALAPDIRARVFLMQDTADRASEKEAVLLSVIPSLPSLNQNTAKTGS